MGKATKTWKIGEYMKGGVLTVEINGDKINIIAKDWDTSTGYSRGSNQSNAKEFDRETYNATDRNVERQMMNFLEDLTTHYYASEVVSWIKSKVQLEANSGWYGW
jgi:hypothetical protein